MEPTTKQLQEAVAFIAAEAKQGNKVLVHCKAGHGRSAAVAFAYLVSSHGGSLTLEQAQAHLSSIRHVRKKLYLQANLQSFYETATRSKGGTATEMM